VAAGNCAVYITLKYLNTQTASLSPGGIILEGFKPHFRKRSVLDKSISLRDVLIYGGMALLVLAAVALIIVIPFMIGRASVSCPSPTINKSEKVTAATALIANAADIDEEEQEEIVEEIEEEIEEEPIEEEVVEEIEEEVEEETEEYDESIKYLRTDPRVATSYNDVDIDLLDYDYEMRGADWGTINTVKVIITNNQDKIIIPYSLKMKIYNQGDAANNWFDDEKSLRDDLNIIAPGDYKIVELDVHVSFSDIGLEKRFGIYLFDEVGKEMTGRVKEITIS
jgi:hypothetical protein